MPSALLILGDEVISHHPGLEPIARLRGLIVEAASLLGACSEKPAKLAFVLPSMLYCAEQLNESSVLH